jgi:YidC/Oxa1 family membrane protein insertase
MEKRILVAFALSFLVFTLYIRFFAPPPPPVGPVDEGAPAGGTPSPAAPRPGGADVAAPSPAGSEETTQEPSAETPDEPTGEVREDTEERKLTVDTPLYLAVFSNRGARLESFVLKQYTDEHENLFQVIPMEAAERLSLHPLDLELEDDVLTKEMRAALFEASVPRLVLNADESKEMAFEWADGRGHVVRKKLGFSGNTYRITVEASAEQEGTELDKRILFGPGIGEVSREGTYVQPDRGVVAAGGALQFFSAGDVEDFPGAAVGVQMVGVSAHYFAGLMVPERDGRYAAALRRDILEWEQEDGTTRPREFISAALEAVNAPLRFTLYVGPKEQERLAELGPGLEGVVDYGSWMRYLAVPLRSALLWIHDYVGNYGWSIVLLTIAINIVLVPLKHHSYVSMRKMQKLGPQIKRIQERYKKLKPTDPRRQEMNKEVYGLYREHNVSPVSGCLPMLLMIPFFFAFYRLLMVSIELRHAPFVLWIQDLSAFDPYFVLPILMGASQVAIQKLSPQTSADPMQARMMMLMPVVFVFILAWAPAGLVLYWFVNNLVSLVQQGVTNRYLTTHPAEEASSGAAKKKKKGQAAG